MRTKPKLTEIALNKWMRKQATDWEKIQNYGQKSHVIKNYQLNGHEFKQTLGDGEGQGNLACHGPWDHKKSDTTVLLNNNNNPKYTKNF